MNDQVFTLIIDRVDKAEKNMCDRMEALEAKVEELRIQRWKAAGRAAAYGSIAAGIGSIIAFVISFATKAMGG